MTQDTPLEAAVVALPDSLDLKAAGPLTTELLAVRGRELVLDASAVRRIGGQCAQVLLSARATWASDGAGFSIVDPSPDFLEGVALMGCADLAHQDPAQ